MRTVAQPGGLLVRVEGLAKTYTQRGGLMGYRTTVPALVGADLDIEAGSVLGLVGESGSGKSTLARCLACLEKPTAGHIWWEGEDTGALKGNQLRRARCRSQMIFQEAATALNPRFRALELVAEPLAIKNVASADRRLRSQVLMEQVGLAPALAARFPQQLSGGQRQRLAIARALAVSPRLLILDEALAGLDPGVARQVLELLFHLREIHRLTYVFISHDLGLVGSFCDTIAVMYQGRIVEKKSAAEVLRHPQHPHTRALLGAQRRVLGAAK